MQEGISYIAGVGAALRRRGHHARRPGPGQHRARSRATTSRSSRAAGTATTATSCWRPNSVQEMCDLTMLAFELADQYRNPVCRAGRRLHRPDDGAGRVPEPRAVELPPSPGRYGHAGDAPATSISSIYLEPDELEAAHPQAGGQVPAGRERRAALREATSPRTPKCCWSGYGIVSRVLRTGGGACARRGPAASACSGRSPCGPSRSQALAELAAQRAARSSWSS